MTFSNTTFGNVRKYDLFYYDNQRWCKATSALKLTRHNAYTTNGARYKLFRSNTQVKVEVR